MIVVFKTWRSPQRRTGSDPERSAGPPISAVESRRYLIYPITIIKYNIKAETVGGTFIGIASRER
jgi:hypothetical protein